MTSILITGCNRGLGLGLVRALNKLPQPPKIFATCRDIEKAEELKQIAKDHQNVHILQIDLLNFDQYERLVKEVDANVQNKGLNVLFNNAGVAPKSTRINAVKEKDLIDTFTCNTVVPIMLTKAFLPLLKKASEFNSSKPIGIDRAAIINMSSILGSISQNDNGGLYAYRTSKAALNCATKSMSIDLKNDKILCVALHPGWVKTNMGGSNAPMEVETNLLNFDQYERLVKEVDANVQNKGLNVLFNNAGVAPKSTRINAVKEKDLIDTFTCNTVVPIMLTKAFLPLLKKASEFNSSKPIGIDRAAIINMSSILGSISQNDNGGLYAYRTSKAALNCATKSMSIDLKNDKILCVALHPGWVKTNMGGSNAPMEVETSADSIIKTILSFNEKSNGRFFQYNGQELAW